MVYRAVFRCWRPRQQPQRAGFQAGDGGMECFFCFWRPLYTTSELRSLLFEFRVAVVVGEDANNGMGWYVSRNSVPGLYVGALFRFSVVGVPANNHSEQGSKPEIVAWNVFLFLASSLHNI